MGILNLFGKSEGLKRRIVSTLQLVLDLASAVPGLESVTVPLQQAIGALGGVAVVHAGGAGTLSTEKIAGLVSALSLLIALSSVFPVLLPLKPYLLKAAGLLAAANLGKKAGAK